MLESFQKGKNGFDYREETPLKTCEGQITPLCEIFFDSCPEADHDGICGILGAV
jgi:hypothetical protein